MHKFATEILYNTEKSAAELRHLVNAYEVEAGTV